MSARDDRRRHERAGRFAELVASLRLWLKGYRLLARRFRTPVGEIDLVMRKGDLVVFVEVKARARRAGALEALGPRQRRRVTRAAMIFLQRHPEHVACRLRFDLVAIAGLRLPLHLEDAWRPDH